MLVRDLMTHTSGLTYDFLDDSPVRELYATASFLEPTPSLAEAIDDLARVSAGLPAGLALALQRRHRRRRAHHRGDLGPAARRLPQRAAVRAARHGRHRASRSRRASATASPRCTAVPTSFDADANAMSAFEVARRLQRTPRRLRHLSRRRARTLSSAAATACSARRATISASPRCWPTAASSTARASRPQDAGADARQPPAAVVAAARDRRPADSRATASASARASRSTSRRPARRGRSANSAGRAPPRHITGSTRRRRSSALFMTQSMLSFDLPELDLRALAYRAIVD